MPAVVWRFELLNETTRTVLLADPKMQKLSVGVAGGV